MTLSNSYIVGKFEEQRKQIEMLEDMYKDEIIRLGAEIVKLKERINKLEKESPSMNYIEADKVQQIEIRLDRLEMNARRNDPLF